MRFRWRCVALGAVAGLWLLTPPVRASLIDDFASPDPGELRFLSGAMPGTRTALIENSSPDVLGLQRDVLIEVLGQPQILSAAAIVGHDPDFDWDALQIATFGSPGTAVTLQYDGVDSADTTSGGLVNTHGLSADLTDGGLSNGFLLAFFSSDGGEPNGLDLEIVATSPLFGTAALAEDHHVPNHTGPFDYFVPFTDFDTADPGAFFARIDSLTFVLNGDGTPDVDYEINAITTVAEPSTLALLGFGALLAAAAAYLRRKR